MRRRLLISASLLASGAAGLLWRLRNAGPGPASERTADGRLMIRAAALAFDTSVSICALHHDAGRARRALSRALKRLTALDALLTVQRPGSQVSQLNAAGVLERPDPHLLRLLAFGMELAQASDGAFDPSVQPLWELHADCQLRRCTPDPDEVLSARARVNWSAIDVSARRVQLGPRMAITLNGLVQGYAADLAFDSLAQDGVVDALIDAGEYGSLGSAPSGQRWRVGIQHPRNPEALIGAVPMDGRFLATSGDYSTHFTDDFASHHIFDPRTGVSPPTLSSVAVAAPSGLLADGLTKPMMVLDLPAAQRLLGRYAGAGAVWIDKSGRIVATRNLALEPA